MGWRRWGAVLVAVALAASACGGAGDDDEAAPQTTTAGDDAEPELAFAEHLAEVLDDDGALGPDAALELFAAAFEELPGIDRDPALVALVEGGGVEPSLALRAAVDLLPTLDDEQAAVVERFAFGEGRDLLDRATAAFEPGGGGEVGLAPPLGSGETAAALIPAETERERAATVLVADFVGQIASRLGRPLGIPVAVVELTPDEASRHFRPTEAASATAVPSSSGSVESCLIRLNPNAAVPLDPVADPRFAGHIAHEVFHCFQYGLFPGNAAEISSWPMWVKEGAPAWAGEELVGGSGQSTSWWVNWLRFPERDLVRRSYDAIGFWSLLGPAGVDPWRRIDAVQSNVRNAYDVALGGDTDAVLGRWGSSLARRADLGDGWDTVGPGVVDEVPPATEVPVRVDAEPVTVTNVLGAQRTGQVVRFEATGHVLTVTVENLTGRVRLPGAGDALFAGSGAFGWCLDGSGCICPDGEPASGPSGALLPADPGDAHVGVASSTGGGRITVGAQTLEAACGDRAATTTTAPDLGGAACLVGTFTSAPWVVPAGGSTGGNGVRLTLEADGTGSVDYGAMNPAVLSAPPEAPPVETHVRFSGAGPVTWGGDDSTLTISYVDPAAFVATSTVIFNGAPVTEQSRTFAELLAEGGAPLSSAPFTCGDDGFRIVLPVPGGTGTFELPFQGG